MKQRRQTPFLPASARRAAALVVLVASGCGGARGGGEGPRRGPIHSASVEWAGLRYEASVRPSPPDRIRLRAVVTNVSPVFREEELPWCILPARLYRDGALAFDYAAARGCGGAVRVVRLEPGESEEFRRTLTAERVLGDSLSPGPFEVHVRLPRQTGRGPPRAAMDLRLGTVTLGRR